MKRVLFSLVVLMLAFVAAACQASSIDVMGSDGQAIHLTQPPRRIISLLPSWTEAVCLLGECDRLVAVDRYSNWPASVRTLPIVGGGLDPDIERILVLKPDLVLAGAAAKANQRLRALGVKVLVIDAQTYLDVHRAIQLMAQALTVSPSVAEQLWSNIEGDVAKAASLVPKRDKPARVYFEVSAEPYAAGSESFIGETLMRLGLINIIQAPLGPFPRINPELVVRADPDVIMMSEGSMATLTDRPGWSTLTAVSQQQVCLFPKSIADVIVRPGPRIAEGARAIADCVRSLSISLRSSQGFLK